MMARDLIVVRDASVAIGHAPKDEGIVFGERKDLPGVFALHDFEMNIGTHGFQLVLLKSSGHTQPAKPH